MAGALCAGGGWELGVFAGPGVPALRPDMFEGDETRFSVELTTQAEARRMKHRRVCALGALEFHDDLVRHPDAQRLQRFPRGAALRIAEEEASVGIQWTRLTPWIFIQPDWDSARTFQIEDADRFQLHYPLQTAKLGSRQTETGASLHPAHVDGASAGVRLHRRGCKRKEDGQQGSHDARTGA